MAEQQLQEDGIDIEGLVARFQAVDREMRETVCADEAPLGKETLLYDKETDQLKSNRQTIQQLDNNLKHLEAGYEMMKKKLASPRDDSPWFKMFMEFADALYKQDSRSTGLLPAEEVLNLTNMYNSSYNLDIPDSVITYTLSDCSQGGNVNIHKYLTKLGQRDW